MACIGGSNPLAPTKQKRSVMDTATMQFCAMSFLLGILVGFFLSRFLYIRTINKSLMILNRYKQLKRFVEEREHFQNEMNKLKEKEQSFLDGFVKIANSVSDTLTKKRLFWWK